MPYGISEDSFLRIVKVFSSFDQFIEVKFFGSRALNRHRPGSDIDLAIKGQNIGLNKLLELRLKLEDLSLPYRFDLVVLDDQISQELLEYIETIGIVIYQKFSEGHHLLKEHP